MEMLKILKTFFLLIDSDALVETTNCRQRLSNSIEFKSILASVKSIQGRLLYRQPLFQSEFIRSTSTTHYNGE